MPTICHRKSCISPVAAALRALILLSLTVLPAAVLSAPDDDTATEDEAALERSHAERLRRAIDKNEADQADHAKRRDSELGRQAEQARLQSRLFALERDENLLQGQMRNAETQLLYLHSDPADMRAHARRSELESRVSYYRSQLYQVTAEKQLALRRLSDLRDSRDLRDLRFR